MTINPVSIWDKWTGGVPISNQEITALEIWASENAINDHYWIALEMANRGLKVTMRDDWGKARTGTFIDYRGGTNRDKD